jgi:endonuclease YncB( thermonuclease family)
VRQGRRQRACAGRIAIIALATVCAAAVSGAEPATNAWATGGVTGTAAPAGMALPYWQAPALPTAVIQGGAIPPGWSPQAVPYRGTGPDGKPLTVYYAPTYTFTYPIGPPMLAAATIPAASQVNRRQALPVAAQPGAAQGWNYQTQSAAPPAYALPPATVARYQPTPYQFPAGSKQLAGTPVVPPSGPPVTAFTAAPPTYQPAPPPPTQWAASQEPPPPGLAPQTAPPTQAAVPPPASIGQTVAAAAPPMVAGAVAAGVQPQTPSPSAFATPPPAAFSASPTSTAIPAQPASTSLAPPPSAAPAGGASTSHLWRVVGVHDGDTITCLDESNQQQKVRLAEIDAPEIGQEYGRSAREALAAMVFGKPVEVVEEGKDRYGRWVGHVSSGGVDVNRQMVATGNAWQYVDYSRDPTLAAAQAQAQAQRLGLWAQPNPTPPWDFRNNGQK